MNVQEKVLKNHKSYEWQYDGYVVPWARPSWSFKNPKPDTGYGRILIEYYKAKAPITAKAMQTYIGKKPTSSSATYRTLKVAGLIEPINHKGYVITKLGKQYVEEMLKDYI